MPRYMISLENKGQHLGFQVLIALMTLFKILVDQFLRLDSDGDKCACHRQLDAGLDSLGERGLIL